MKRIYVFITAAVYNGANLITVGATLYTQLGGGGSGGINITISEDATAEAINAALAFAAREWVTTPGNCSLTPTLTSDDAVCIVNPVACGVY